MVGPQERCWKDFKNINNINTHLIRSLVLTTLTYALKNKRAYLKLGFLCLTSPALVGVLLPFYRTSISGPPRTRCSYVVRVYVQRDAYASTRRHPHHRIEHCPKPRGSPLTALSLSGQTPALSQLLTSHISPQFGLVSVVFNHQYSSSPIRLDTSSHRQTNTQQYKTPAKLTHLTSSLPCMWARVRSPHKRVPPSDVTLKK